MKEYFSIGETAKINNVSIQALRLYDRMGLLKPAYVDPENNYRYYTID
ncbi:MerR family DNA-binding transcriptional regulator [Clostridium ganghwense]|nr:MerR family DNA-binding transcriptional regulator [Clostridium ganghwense]